LNLYLLILQVNKLVVFVVKKHNFAFETIKEFATFLLNLLQALFQVDFLANIRLGCQHYLQFIRKLNVLLIFLYQSFYVVEKLILIG